MYERSSFLTTSVGKVTSFQTSGFLWDVSAVSAQNRGGQALYVIDSLKASTACPYFLFKGQPISEYSVSIGVLVFSATCRMIEATILPLLNRSSHFTMSSADTLRFDRSI